MTWTAETLLADTAWMRALARRLVAGNADADDLVQEAWVLALRRKERPPRAWLAAVLRKLSLTRRRSESRRAHREEHAARPELTPGMQEAAERVEAQRDLVEALLTLDEPYRSTLIWRYSEGLDPGEIARRSEAPLGTVHSRLSRGLDHMREELERRGTRRDGWLAALAPLLDLEHVTTPAAASVAGGGAKALGAAALVILATGLAWTLRGSTPLEPDPRAAPPEQEVLLALAGAEEVVAATPAVVETRREANDEASRQPASEYPRWSMALTVKRSDMEPAAGAQVTLVRYYGEFHDTLLLGETDAEGRLERPLESLDAMGWATWNAGGASLLVRYPSHVLAHLDLPVDEFERPGLFERILILDSSPQLTGRVVDELGKPVVGARCWAIPLEDGKRQKELAFSHTADDGYFSLSPQPDRAGYISVETEGQAMSSHVLDLGQARDLGDLQLTSGATLEGRVLDAEGSPARGVEIQVHCRGELRTPREDGTPRPGRSWAQAPTDREGCFRFTGLRFGRYDVTASAGTSEHVTEVELPCPLLTLRITEPRLIVRVQDAHGRPEVGVFITLTPLDGPWEEPPDQQWISTWGPEAEGSAEVTSGATYSLVVDGRGGDTREHVVHIPEGRLEHRELLTIGLPQATGSLLVTAVDPDGIPVKVNSVAFLSETSGQNLESLEAFQPDAEGRVANLPIGRYKAHVYLDRGDAFERRLFRPRIAMPFEVREGEESKLVAHALTGARITLHLDPDGWPVDVPEPPDSSNEGYLTYLRTYGLSPVFASDVPDDFTVSPPRRNSRPLMRLPDVPVFAGLVAKWIPGEAGRHWNIEPPGTYRIRVTGAGWQDAETEIELSPGEDALVRMVISAER